MLMMTEYRRGRFGQRFRYAYIGMHLIIYLCVICDLFTPERPAIDAFQSLRSEITCLRKRTQ